MKFCWSIIIKLVVVFLLSFVLYQGINKIVLSVLQMDTTPYLTEQIMWGKITAKECIKNILNHMYKVVIGEGIFLSFAYTIVCVGMFVYILVRFKKKQSCYIMYFLSAVFVMLSPFLMTLLLGAEPKVRAQFLLPFVTGAVCQYLLNILYENGARLARVGYTIALAVTVCLSMHQSLASAKLFYTQYVQYDEDVRLATKISDRIERLDLGEMPEEPVVFIGSRGPQLNAVTIESSQLQLIGRSFFELSFGTMHGTWVMNHFMDTIGYSYNLPSQEQITQAEVGAKDMPSWPYNGCIEVKDGVVIVKMGEL